LLSQSGNDDHPDRKSGDHVDQFLELPSVTAIRVVRAAMFLAGVLLLASGLLTIQTQSWSANTALGLSLLVLGIVLIILAIDEAVLRGKSRDRPTEGSSGPSGRDTL